MRARTIATAVATLLSATAASAQPVIVADSGDSAWVLAAALIAVAAFAPGLVLTYARGETATRTAALALSGAVMLFVAIGYSIGFGAGSPILGGAGNAFLARLSELRDGTTIADSVFVVAQLATMLLAVGLVATALVDTARSTWLALFAPVWMLVVYVPVARWLDSGWLADLGALDYASGIAVQLTAGVATVVGGLLANARGGVTSERTLPGHGPLLLGVGMLALLGVAPLGAGDDAAGALISGAVAASAGLLAASVLSLKGREHAPLWVGGIAGLAAISSGAGAVGPLGAMLVGALGGATAALVLRARPAGVPTTCYTAFAAHAVGAAAGAIAFPVFIFPGFGGPGFEEGTSLFGQLGAQIVAVVAVTLWTAVATAIVALAVSVVAPMRPRRRG